MTAISKLLEKEINGLTVKLFQLDVDNEQTQKINTPNRAKYHICLLLKR